LDIGHHIVIYLKSIYSKGKIIKGIYKCILHHANTKIGVFKIYLRDKKQLMVLVSATHHNYYPKCYIIEIILSIAKH
jgi:hypothetical protein